MLHFEIRTDQGRYVGLVTMYDGRFTHSISNYSGSAPQDLFPFNSKEEAEADFWETKARLPKSVHDIIFCNLI